MNRIKRFVVLFITIILLSGCVQSNITTRINKDKSMNLEVDVRIKNENVNEELIDTKSIEDRGFKVTHTTEEEYSVYNITRTFNSIDELSKGTKDTVDISDILESGFDFSKLFVKTSSFFKDTYSANFVYSIDKLKSRYSSLLSEEDSDVELKYTLVIPTKALSNDASEVSSDKKYLTWKLSTTEESKINYTFEILNTKHLIMVGGGALVLIIILIVLIIIIKKKKSSKSSLIYKEYDPSIEGELNKNEVINTEATKVEASSEPQIESNVQATVVDTTTGNVIEPTKPASVEQKEEAPVVSNPVVESTPEVPTVETAVDNMEMQSLPSLEFEVPDNVVQEPEIKEESFNFTPNTYDYNRRPDFVKSFEPNKFVDETKIESEEEVVIDTPSVVDSIDVPSYTEPLTPEPQAPMQNNTFIQNVEETPGVETPKPSVTAGLDVPNGVALSDIPSTK